MEQGRYHVGDVDAGVTALATIVVPHWVTTRVTTTTTTMVVAMTKEATMATMLAAQATLLQEACLPATAVHKEAQG
jgi:hypothetical protein